MAGRYGLQVRAAQATDAAGIAELLAACGRAAGPAVLADRLGALRRDSGTVLLAQEGIAPSGIVAAAWIPVLDGDGPRAEITLLLVHPDDRRRGIGRVLLKAVAQSARAAGCAALRLAVEPETATLAGFAAAAGFEPAGTVLVRSLRKRRPGS